MLSRAPLPARLLVVLLGALALVGAAATQVAGAAPASGATEREAPAQNPASAAPSAPAAAPSESEGTIVVIDGDVVVGPRERVADVYVVSGDVRVDGVVDGDVVAVSGDVLLAGRVGGNVVTVSGRARLLRSARVGGDVRYSEQRPVVSPLARVNGDVTDEGWSDGVDILPVLGSFVVWLAVTVSFLLLGALLLLLAPRAADALYERSRERTGPTIAIGIAISISLPIAILLAAVTVLGIPLAIGGALAAAPLGAVAYTATAYAIGRRMVGPPRGRLWAMLAGLALLRAIALVPIVGLLVGLAAVVYGFGLIGAAIGAARRDDAGAEPPGEALSAPGSPST